jgi:hypothetical protein
MDKYCVLDGEEQVDDFGDPEEYRRRIKIKAKMHKVLAEVEQEMEPAANAAPHR